MREERDRKSEESSPLDEVMKMNKTPWVADILGTEEVAPFKQNKLTKVKGFGGISEK